MTDALPSRPEPAERAHDLSQHRTILAELLEVERARLQVALRIEKERSIVFPETTVIVKDIQRLSAALLGKPDTSGTDGAPDDEGEVETEFSLLDRL